MFDIKIFQTLTILVIICETIRALNSSQSSIRFIKLCILPFEWKQYFKMTPKNQNSQVIPDYEFFLTILNILN